MIIVAPDPAGIALAAEHLRAGGTVAHPTETCYGFACDLRDPAAVTQLFALKRRPHDKPVSGLFATVEEARHWTVWNAQAEELAARHLPGPLTIIVPLRQESALLPSPEGGATLGVRVSSHPVATALARAAGFPISTTSANLHGMPNPYAPEDIAAQYPPHALDAVLCIDGGRLPAVPPSTVIDLVTGAVRRGGTVDPSHALPSL